METLNMGTPASSLLQGTGFRPANTIKSRQRMILNVQGKEDTGKTHFLLTCPEPIALFDLDLNSESVVNKSDFLNKEIMMSEYFFEKPSKGSNEAKLIKEADLLWNRFMAEYKQALKEVKTVAIDTAGLLWEMLRIARFGKLTSVMPHHYGVLNCEMAQIIDMSKQSDCNLILSSTLAPQYINDQATGFWVRQGWSQLDYKVQYSIELSRSKTGPNKGKFEGKILKFKPDPKMIDQVLINPSFKDISERAFPKGIN